MKHYKLVNQQVGLIQKIIYSFGENKNIVTIEAFDESLVSLIKFLKEVKSLDEILGAFPNFSFDQIGLILDEFVNLNLVSEIILDENRKKLGVFNFNNNIEFIKDKIEADIVKLDEEELLSDSSCDILIIFFPLYESIDFIIKLSDRIRNIKTPALILGINNQLISLGPIIDERKGTASLECYFRRRLAGENKAYNIYNFINEKSKIIINKQNKSDHIHYPVFIEMVVFEIDKYLKGNSNLYSKEIEISLETYESSTVEIFKTMQYFKTLTNVF